METTEHLYQAICCACRCRFSTTAFEADCPECGAWAEVDTDPDHYPEHYEDAN